MKCYVEPLPQQVKKERLCMFSDCYPMEVFTHTKIISLRLLSLPKRKIVTRSISIFLLMGAIRRLIVGDKLGGFDAKAMAKANKSQDS